MGITSGPSQQELLLKEISKCIYFESKWAIYYENGSYHISSACFAIDSIKTTIIDLIANYIKNTQIAIIVGFSEGIDQAIISFTTVIAYYKLKKPFFTYTMNETYPPSKISSHLNSCSLLLPYTSYSEQILEILDFVVNQGGCVKQVVTLVDEKGQAEAACTLKGIDFKKIISLVDIINCMKKFPNLNKKKVNSISKLLTSN